MQALPLADASTTPAAVTAPAQRRPPEAPAHPDRASFYPVVPDADDLTGSELSGTQLIGTQLIGTDLTGGTGAEASDDDAAVARTPLARMALTRARMRAVIPIDVVAFTAACPACGADCEWTQERHETRVRSTTDCPCAGAGH